MGIGLYQKFKYKLIRQKSIINNIDNKLDEIIVYLYTGQIPIVHSEQE